MFDLLSRIRFGHLHSIGLSILLSSCGANPVLVQEFKEAKKPILIYKLQPITNLSFLDHKNLLWQLVNTSSRPIKYIKLEVVGVNPVGDDVPMMAIPGNIVTFVGPIPPGADVRWGVSRYTMLWYSSTVVAVRPVSISIEYMDGKILIFREKARLMELFDPEIDFEDAYQKFQRAWSG